MLESFDLGWKQALTARLAPSALAETSEETPCGKPRGAKVPAVGSLPDKTEAEASQREEVVQYATAPTGATMTGRPGKTAAMGQATPLKQIPAAGCTQSATHRAGSQGASTVVADAALPCGAGDTQPAPTPDVEAACQGRMHLPGCSASPAGEVMVMPPEGSVRDTEGNAAQAGTRQQRTSAVQDAVANESKYPVAEVSPLSGHSQSQSVERPATSLLHESISHSMADESGSTRTQMCYSPAHISAEAPVPAVAIAMAAAHAIPRSEGTSAAGALRASAAEDCNAPGLQDLTNRSGGVVSSTLRPGQFEVGVMDGTHGWLQIRSQLAPGGGVSASLTTAAATSHTSLGQALPSMASYLASESVQVTGITVHRASEDAGRRGQMPSDLSGQHSSSERDAERPEETSHAQRQKASGLAQSSLAVLTLGDSSPRYWAALGTAAAPGTSGRGSWLSVLA